MTNDVAGELSTADLRTLQLAPFWLLSTITSKDRGFSPPDRRAFTAAVNHARVLATDTMTVQILDSVIEQEGELWQRYEDDHRSVNTGLHDVGRILRALEPGQAAALSDALLRTIGGGVATARGPFGQRASVQDVQRLQLAAVLMGYDRQGTPVG